jgi:hypothetical protein
MADSSASAVITQSKQQTNGLSAVSFPADLPPFFTSIQFYEYRAAVGSSSSPTSNAGNQSLSPIQKLFSADKGSVNNQIQKNSFATIQLPIPANLNDSFRVDYENTSLGGLIGAGSDIASAGQATMKNLLNSDGSINAQALNNSATGGTGKEAALASTKLALKYLQEHGGTFGTNLSGLNDLASGSAINPNLAVLFKGPTLKSHQFTWTLTPRNSTESAAIKKMIAIIKRAMHPTRQASGTVAILGYPCECLVSFIGTSTSSVFLYPMRPTVLENLAINYAPSNVPSFFQNTNEPTSVEITMQFQETSYYTRDSFDDGSQYGADGFSTGQVSKGDLTSGYSPPFTSANTGGN